MGRRRPLIDAGSVGGAGAALRFSVQRSCLGIPVVNVCTFSETLSPFPPNFASTRGVSSQPSTPVKRSCPYPLLLATILVKFNRARSMLHVPDFKTTD